MAPMVSDRSNVGEIFYRDTSDMETLQKFNEIVDTRFQTNFKSKIAVIITFVNMTSASNPNLKNSFQVVIGSDNITTFAIFNYIHLDSNNAVAGFSESECNSHQLTITGKSKQLITKSNVLRNGTFVFKLNPVLVNCSSHSQCQRNSVDELICTCPSECENHDFVCGTDSVTYDSPCHMKKLFCEKYGVETIMNISIVTEYPCSG